MSNFNEKGLDRILRQMNRLKRGKPLIQNTPNSFTTPCTTPNPPDRSQFGSVDGLSAQAFGLKFGVVQKAKFSPTDTTPVVEPTEPPAPVIDIIPIALGLLAPTTNLLSVLFTKPGDEDSLEFWLGGDRETPLLLHTLPCVEPSSSGPPAWQWEDPDSGQTGILPPGDPESIIEATGNRVEIFIRPYFNGVAYNNDTPYNVVNLSFVGARFGGAYIDPILRFSGRGLQLAWPLIYKGGFPFEYDTQNNQNFFGTNPTDAGYIRPDNPRFTSIEYSTLVNAIGSRIDFRTGLRVPVNSTSYLSGYRVRINLPGGGSFFPTKMIGSITYTVRINGASNEQYGVAVGSASSPLFSKPPIVTPIPSPPICTIPAYRAYISRHNFNVFFGLIYDSNLDGTEDTIIYKMVEDNILIDIVPPNPDPADWRSSLLTTTTPIPSSGDVCIDEYRSNERANLYNGIAIIAPTLTTLETALQANTTETQIQLMATNNTGLTCRSGTLTPQSIDAYKIPEGTTVIAASAIATPTADVIPLEIGVNG